MRRTILIILAVAIAGCASAASGRPGAMFADCADCPTMIVLPAGDFVMGSPSSEQFRDDDEGPQRRTTVSRAFALGRTEVSRGQYAAFARATERAETKDCRTDRNVDGHFERDALGGWRDPGFPQTDNDPVVCVTWDDAKAYARWLSGVTGRAYRLPSEVEWEFAARAGAQTIYAWGDDPAEACAFANVSDAGAGARFPAWTVLPCDDGAVNTAPVARYRANAFGLYDMIGNVWEWTEDCYAGGIDTVPDGGRARETLACETRVNRGAAWFGNARHIRLANRSRIEPGFPSAILGFRVARDL